jgi:mono/diheme cytochrome c family protein
MPILRQKPSLARKPSHAIFPSPPRPLVMLPPFSFWLPIFLIIGGALTETNAATAEPANANNAGEALFTDTIEPILSEHCYKCHSHSADKIRGGLVVDSLDALLAGGDSGPAIVAGQPEKSLLIEAVRYANEDLQMPPKNKKLSEPQIAALTEWIRLGAPWPKTVSTKNVRPRGVITDDDRKWWAFQPLQQAAVPENREDNHWSQNEIDRFVLDKLAREDLTPAPPATKAVLLRRVYFDLVGLPPTPVELDAFLADPAPDAFAKVVDRLLASPHYGEHWARHWLDLVRYAESDGFRIDDYRPHAWHYRDYVIRAFNSDKPYDRFIREQIAGDEIAPDDPEARIATGFLRHWVYEYNNRDVVGQWTNILNDVTDVTADLFLGLGVQCARCHDHKFDPILQKDYYRLQAFFAPLLPREDLFAATPRQETEYRAALRAWEEKTAALRGQIAEIERPHKEKAAYDAIIKFPPGTQALIHKPAAERTPLEHQLAELAYRQVTYEYDRVLNRIKGPDKETLVALYRQLAAFDQEKPAPLPIAFCATDVGAEAPPVRIPKKKESDIAPGFLEVLGASPPQITKLTHSTGRRTALAQWLTSPDNPLTARVIVNRIWQYHFGRGLVGTSSDFGRLGEKPSHPELLDWLARRFTDDGWSLKKLHRLILLSATYQQAAHNPSSQSARRKDPENRWLWRGSTRRLDAEQIRDSILAVTGELDLDEAGGPSVDAAKPRRTIYTKVVRNVRDPLLDAFDAPEGFASTAQRNVTTTPAQSLLMINSAWSLQRARAFAKRLSHDESMDLGRTVTEAYRLALNRQPTARERDDAAQFVERQAALLPRKKAEPAPAPFQSERIPFRDGRAAMLAPGSTQPWLTAPNHPALPSNDFTVEAFVMVRSLYETGEVRTIASPWDGERRHPGWSLGITSKQSRYKPQTLVLLLSGDQPWRADDPVEPIFSGLHIELGKPFFVAAAVRLGDVSDKGVTFYAKDLSNDDEPMQIAQVAHTVTTGIASDAAVTIGARAPHGTHLFDGLIDDVRISRTALPSERLLLADERASEQTAAWWKFEPDPGVYADSSGHGNAIVPRIIATPSEDPKMSALVDFCHVLLNTNEFLYVD